MVQRHFFYLLISVLFSSCDQDCTSSPSCIAPPGGTFKENAINIAIHESLLEEVEESSYRSLALINSVVVHTNAGEVTISDFYQWVSFEDALTITSIDIFYDENSINVDFEDFIFNETESDFSLGGYLFTFIKSLETYSLQIDKASQSLIDGECNDVVGC